MRMMGLDETLITPIPGKHPKSIGRRCAMVGNPLDVDAVCALAGLTPKRSRGLLLSRLYYSSEMEADYSIIGPFIGAPYAAILLETAISWGVKEIVFFGWCGAVAPDIQIGDIILPNLALIDEGTSKNYNPQRINESKPSFTLQDRLKKQLSDKRVMFHEGSIWTTDAIFRETQKKVALYQRQGVLGVEMEASALFSIGLFRNVEVGCLFVVSDIVSSHQWIQGFSNPKFKESRQHAAGVVSDFLINNPPLER
jgi:purine-nucleoside phosphorylase